MKFTKINNKYGNEIQKKLSFGLFFLYLFGINLWAEIPVALLKGIHNNSFIVLNYKNTAVVCEPFGVKTLEILQKESMKQEECSKTISKIYLDDPYLQNFAKLKLHLEQTYHFNLLEKKCILYGNGTETYSEMLLSEGLAVIDENFNDREWNEKLKRAYGRGEKQKKGIHAKPEALGTCIDKKK